MSVLILYYIEFAKPNILQTNLIINFRIFESDADLNFFSIYNSGVINYLQNDYGSIAITVIWGTKIPHYCH